MRYMSTAIDLALHCQRRHLRLALIQFRECKRDVTLEALQAEGTAAPDLLLHFGRASGSYV
jgi:hypothetical protein